MGSPEMSLAPVLRRRHLHVGDVRPLVELGGEVSDLGEDEGVVDPVGAGRGDHDRHRLVQ